MKRFTYFVLSLFLGSLFVACEEKINPKPQQEPIPVEEEVSVYFIYNLPADNGGSMTKSTNAEVFGEFYEKIVSAELVAEEYSLELTETTTGSKYEFKGTWNSHSMVTVKTGQYHIKGVCTASGENIQDKCSFTFDETVDISASSSAITLTAHYDCFLLIFSANDIATLSNYNGEESKSFFTFKTYKYAFVNGTLFKEGKKDKAYIGGTYTDNADFKCYTGTLSFEKGKYYVYSSVTGGFSVPLMEEGGDTNNKADKVAVDLGLSVKWASANIGATTEEGIGNRFAWGEIEPDKEWYDWDNYKWVIYNGYYDFTFTKYHSEVDGKTSLDIEDDAAHVILGGSWRMPTVAEAQELIDCCSWVEEEINGVSGFRVTGSNNKSIFIPLSGQFDDSGSIVNMDMVLLWTSQCTDSYGYRLGTENWAYSHTVAAYNEKQDGLCIRGVCK